MSYGGSAKKPKRNEAKEEGKDGCPTEGQPENIIRKGGDERKEEHEGSSDDEVGKLPASSRSRREREREKVEEGGEKKVRTWRKEGGSKREGPAPIVQSLA